MKVIFTTDDILSMVRANRSDMSTLIDPIERDKIVWKLDNVDRLTAYFVSYIDSYIRDYLLVFKSIKKIDDNRDIKSWMRDEVNEYLNIGRKNYMRNDRHIPIEFTVYKRGDLLIFSIDSVWVKTIGQPVLLDREESLERIFREISKHYDANSFYSDRDVLEFIKFKINKLTKG